MRHDDESLAGQDIAIFRAFAVVTSLFISVLAGPLNRKTLQPGLMCIMAVSGAVIADSTQLPDLLAATLGS